MSSGTIGLSGGLGRFTRLSNGFSRKPDNLRAAVVLYVCWDTRCWKHRGIGSTPAAAIGMTR